MAVYCIGDLHGCCDEFMKLLEKISFDERRDLIYLTGDLIGRGPKPLETVRFIMDHRLSFRPVLGNHDLNFLAVVAGEREARARDNLEPLLNSPALNDIVAYFCSLPFMEFDDDGRFAVCHAGIHPLWDLQTAKKLSKELSKVISDPLRRRLYLRNMYKDSPAAWDPECQGMVRWRFATNVFTRMRLVHEDLSLDYGHSTVSPEEAKKEHLDPWFDYTPELRWHKNRWRLVFGHWAALNAKCPRDDVIALDTGCVWGGSLTAWNTQSGKRVSVPSKGHLKPSK
jgi:bis(5'-nucleosyl)-tetraphosphatase (symmetrical)